MMRHRNQLVMLGEPTRPHGSFVALVVSAPDCHRVAACIHRDVAALDRAEHIGGTAHNTLLETLGNASVTAHIL